MRKMIWTLLAMMIVRLLPKTVRAEVIVLMYELALASKMTVNTSKTMSNTNRTGILESRVGTLQSQRGTVGSLGPSVPHLSNTQSGDPQVDSTVVQTSGVQGATVSGSNVAQHTHSYGHFHFTGLEPDFDGFVDKYNTTLTALNQLFTALHNAQII